MSANDTSQQTDASVDYEYTGQYDFNPHDPSQLDEAVVESSFDIPEGHYANSRRN